MARDTFSSDAHDVRRLLHDHRIQTASPTTADGALDARSQADMQHILSTPGASATARSTATGSDKPRRHATTPSPPLTRLASRRTLLGLAAAACAAAAGITAVDVIAPRGLAGLVGLEGASAEALVPSLLQFNPLPGTAAEHLGDIAARTAALPDDVGSGPIAYREQRSWSLYTRVEGDRATSANVEQYRQSWTDAEGAGRFVVEDVRQGRTMDRVETTVAAGESGYMWPLGSLSAEPTVLARQLEQGHPVANGPAERLVAITDAVREQPLSPAVRAQMLDYLAQTPGLRLDGAVQDRAGRNGIGVSVDSNYSGLPTRYTVIVDPQDGRVLAFEQMLTTTAGKLNVRVPGVIDYQLFLASRYETSFGGK